MSPNFPYTWNIRDDLRSWLMSCILSVKDYCWVYAGVFDLLNWLIWSIIPERCFILWSRTHSNLKHPSLPNCIASFNKLLYNLKNEVWGSDFGTALILSKKLTRLPRSVEYWKHWNLLTWVKLEIPTWSWMTICSLNYLDSRMCFFLWRQGKSP